MAQIANILRSLVAAGVALSAVVAFTTAPQAAASSNDWSRGVTNVCAHALLFEGSHEIGTRAGAVAVAQDIRSSTERRLTRIAALSTRPTQPTLAAHWLAVESRLAAVYASSYLRVFDVIAAANAPEQQEQAARLLGRLLHAPDRLRQVAALLEDRLQVPDCTGGTARPSPSNPPVSAAGPTRR
jgi:hypothetical protein